MRPLHGFWRVVTTLGAMGHALAGWRHLIGEEAHLAEGFLRPTPETAPVYPCDPKCSMNNGRRIVENGPDDFVGVCRDDRCADVQLRTADIVRYQSDIGAVARALLAPLGLASRPVEDTPAPRWWRVGAFLAAGGLDVPVVLSTAVMPRELRAGTERLLCSGLAPFIVLVAHPETVDLETSAMLKRSRCAAIVLQDVVGVDDAKALVALRPIAGALEAVLGAALPAVAAPAVRLAAAAVPSRTEEGNVFRCEGESWLIRFDGRTTRVTEKKGLLYLRHLLREPERKFHAAQLHAAVAGVAHAPAVGSAGEVLDRAALAGYRQRLQDLTDDLAEAVRDNDLARRQKLEEERSALVCELSAATGLGGAPRTASSDADNLRCSITMAISREVKRMRAHHPALATHLDQCIETGAFFSYRPDARTTWAA